jgi:Tol biopolymer transport system component
MRRKVKFQTSRSLLTGALSIALIGLGMMGSFGCHPKKVEAPRPIPTPVPTLPPGSVVFVQRGHLARLDLETSQITPLTSGISTEWFPSCSPRGDQVIYWSNAGQTESAKVDSAPSESVYNLWKINLDGTQRIQLTYDETTSLRTSGQNHLVNDAPSWSPDGMKILYATNGDIWTMDSDGFNQETILSGHSASCPVYSPDGKSVLFISNSEDPVYNLWSLTLSDQTLKKLTNYTDWSVGSPSFSRDGIAILFNLYRSNITQIYTIKPDGSNPINVSNNNSTHYLCPRFGQTNSKIFYCASDASDESLFNIYSANIVKTVDKSSGADSEGLAEPKALTTEGGFDPSWAPALTNVPSTLKTPTPAPAPTPIIKTMIPTPAINIPVPTPVLKK